MLGINKVEEGYLFLSDDLKVIFILYFPYSLIITINDLKSLIYFNFVFLILYFRIFILYLFFIYLFIIISLYILYFKMGPKSIHI